MLLSLDSKLSLSLPPFAVRLVPLVHLLPSGGSSLILQIMPSSGLLVISDDCVIYPAAFFGV